MYGPTAFLSNIKKQFHDDPHVRSIENTLGNTSKTPLQQYKAIEKAVMKLMARANTLATTRGLLAAWHRYQEWHRRHGHVVAAVPRSNKKLGNLPPHLVEALIAPKLNMQNKASLLRAGGSKHYGLQNLLKEDVRALYREIEDLLRIFVTTATTTWGRLDKLPTLERMARRGGYAAYMVQLPNMPLHGHTFEVSGRKVHMSLDLSDGLESVATFEFKTQRAPKPMAKVVLQFNMRGNIRGGYIDELEHKGLSALFVDAAIPVFEALRLL